MNVKMYEGDNTLKATFYVPSIKTGREYILKAFKLYTISDRAYIKYGQKTYGANDIYSSL